jgi:hypothetical protein
MSDRERPWPPLIVATSTPAAIRWRDLLLTVVMWGLFFVVLESEFELYFGAYLEHWGFGDFDTDADWAEFFHLLLPYLEVSAVLIATLALVNALGVKRRRRSLSIEPPPPLTLAEEARRAGMGEAELAAARELRIAVVHIDADGKLGVEPRPS